MCLVISHNVDNYWDIKESGMKKWYHGEEKLDCYIFFVCAVINLFSAKKNIFVFLFFILEKAKLLHFIHNQRIWNMRYMMKNMEARIE